MNKLREYRLAAGLTQQFVALSLGVKAPSVNNWESGKSKPKTERLKALAELYGVTVDELLNEPPKSKQNESDDHPSDLDKSDADECSKVQNEIMEALKNIPEKEISSLLQYVKFLSSKSDK